MRNHPEIVSKRDPLEVPCVKVGSPNPIWVALAVFSEGSAEIVEATPVQTTETGIRWQKLLSRVVAVMAAQWRRQMWLAPHSAITAARKALQTLIEDTAAFVSDSNIGAVAQQQLGRLLGLAQLAMLHHVNSYEAGRWGEASVLFDSALLRTHSVVSILGEELALLA